jgi:Flp pilus assembly protein TadB
VKPALLVAVALAVAALAWPPRPRKSARLVRLGTSPTTSAGSHHGPRWWWAALAVPAVAVGGAPLLVISASAAAVVAVAVRRRRNQPLSDPDLPLTVDLLGACLRAGAPLPSALRAAAAASRGDTAEACRSTAADLDAGASPAAAWSGWTGSPDQAAVAQVCLRVSMSGAAAADELVRVAARMRARQRAAMTKRAQRAGTWVVLPLGLCFLPAFVLVGVVPLGLGLVASWR